MSIWCRCLGVLLFLVLSLPSWAQTPEVPSGAHIRTILERGALRVGVKADYPPWGMVDQNGDLVGLEPDLARDLADRLGVTLNLVPVTASNRLSKLDQDEIDIVLATMADTATRRKQMTIVFPTYYASGVTAYGRLAPGVNSWNDLRGQNVCMTQGAFYNRFLEEEHSVRGQYYPTNRETKMALAFERCLVWAFDNTLVAQLDLGPVADSFGTLDEHLFVTPWAVAVAKNAPDASLADFLSDVIKDWHAQGAILALEDKWGIGHSPFVREMNQLWTRPADGVTPAICNIRQTDPGAQCLGAQPFELASPAAEPPAWVTSLEQRFKIDLSVLFEHSSLDKLTQGLLLTLGISVTSITGALSVGIAFSLFEALIRRRSRWLQILLWPQRLLMTVARMTPPILQMYIVFFGVGAVLVRYGHTGPGAFLSGALILSLYAGSTCAVVLGHAFETEKKLHPEAPVLTHFPNAFRRAYEGIVAACVNVVKAAGLTSVMALPELVSSVNLIILEGGPAGTLMNGLVLIYLLLVLLVLQAFALLRRLITPISEEPDR